MSMNDSIKQITSLILIAPIFAFGTAMASETNMKCSFLPEGDATKLVVLPTTKDKDGRPVAEIAVADGVFSAVFALKEDVPYHWLVVSKYRDDVKTGKRNYLSTSSAVLPKGGFKGGTTSLMLKDDSGNILDCHLQ